MARRVDAAQRLHPLLILCAQPGEGFVPVPLGLLADLLDTLGDRRIALARELTKIHEEVIRTTLAEAANRFADGSARGEFVLVVEGAAQETPAKPCTVEEAAALALSLAAEESLPLSEACRRAAAQTGLPRNRIYKAASAQHEASRP